MRELGPYCLRRLDAFDRIAQCQQKKNADRDESKRLANPSRQAKLRRREPPREREPGVAHDRPEQAHRQMSQSSGANARRMHAVGGQLERNAETVRDGHDALTFAQI